jgi:hypothetical protein
MELSKRWRAGGGARGWMRKRAAERRVTPGTHVGVADVSTHAVVSMTWGVWVVQLPTAGCGAGCWVGGLRRRVSGSLAKGKGRVGGGAVQWGTAGMKRASCCRESCMGNPERRAATLPARGKMRGWGVSAENHGGLALTAELQLQRKPTIPPPPAGKGVQVKSKYMPYLAALLHRLLTRSPLRPVNTPPRYARPALLNETRQGLAVGLVHHSICMQGGCYNPCFVLAML